MATRKRTPAKAPGENIEEWQRHTERLTLRLDPEAMELLASYAKSLGWTKAQVVEAALESFKNDKRTQALMLRTPNESEE